MSLVGIIANPAAGKDIRRIVAHGRFVPNYEKANIIRRILAGISATPAKRVLMMPDSGMLCHTASRDLKSNLHTDFIEMQINDEEDDSTRAARKLAELGASCIVTLGGDGTNRAVAKGSGQVPLVPISTGTNNVFPYLVEGTVAGLAAGVVASDILDSSTITTPTKLLTVTVDGEFRDISLVDVAVSTERFIGSRAIWDMATLHEVFLARTEPDGIGLSAIGARLQVVGSKDAIGLHMRLGQGGLSVIAPIAPGVVENVQVAEWTEFQVGEVRSIGISPCTIALDGERSISIGTGQSAEIVLSRDGPPVVDIAAVITEATELGLFTKSP